MKLLKDKGVSYKVAWALGQIGDPAAIPPVIRALDDPSPDMRVASIPALEKLRAEEALPRLRALTQDGERIHTGGMETVADTAKSAIATLTAAP